MTEALTTFTKTPAERKRYLLDYRDWLDTDEKVATVAFSADDELVVDGHIVSSDGGTVTFFVSGGHDGDTYPVVVTADTTGGQTKQVVIEFVVNAY